MGRAPGRFKQLRDLLDLLDRNSEIQQSEPWDESALLVSSTQKLLVGTCLVRYRGGFLSLYWS